MNVFHRDKNGRVRGKRKIVGKVDPILGARIYKEVYIAEKHKENVIISNPTNVKIFSIDDINECQIKEFGLFSFLYALADRSGITNFSF
jgi:hypothetical protein